MAQDLEEREGILTRYMNYCNVQRHLSTAHRKAVRYLEQYSHRVDVVASSSGLAP